jgi:hypothetical protein
MVNMSDEQLVAAFEAGQVPDGGFHHAQHVRVAWYYVRRHPLGEALTRFSGALKRFAIAQGKPDLYHETITTAYVLLISERVGEAASGEWAEFAAGNADLLQWKPSVLERYYNPDTLWSARARTTFVMPDRITSPSEPSRS